MPAPKFYDIATAYGDVVAEALAEQDGLFVHHMLADDGESFHEDKFVVSAISCGYRATRGYWFQSLETAVSYMNAVAPLTDWRAMMPDTPIAPAWPEVTKRPSDTHKRTKQEHEARSVRETKGFQPLPGSLGNWGR